MPLCIFFFTKGRSTKKVNFNENVEVYFVPYENRGNIRSLRSPLFRDESLNFMELHRTHFENYILLIVLVMLVLYVISYKPNDDDTNVLLFAVINYFCFVYLF